MLLTGWWLFFRICWDIWDLEIEAKYVPQDEFQKLEVHSDPH